MRSLVRITAVLTFAGALFSCAASDRSYHSNVSDIEVEDSVKGCTYDQGPKSYFGNKKNCCNQCETCAAPQTATTTQSSQTAPVGTTTVTTNSTNTTTTTNATTSNRPIKYILDGKPVYEDGAKGEAGETGTTGTPGTETKAQAEPAKIEAACADLEIKASIKNIGTAAWREAQARIVASGKCAIPSLIEALGQPNAVAYQVAGHTKADLGRAPRQLTIAEVCAELLNEIVTNHSNYSGDLPGASQKAWQDWWAKNGASVNFGS